MKKIFKKLKIRDLIFFIIGGIVIGTLGITANTYLLQSSEIQYKDNKSVQQAIEELYTLAENGINETLPIGAATIVGYKITIPYTGSYPNIRCVYGTTESYGNVGTINNNTCYFTGTSSNQTLYYKIVATNNNGKIYQSSGNQKTGSCGNFDDNGNCIKSKTYTTGNVIKLGGYNWHVISDTGTNLTLLMDSNQLGSNSNMGHTSSGATYSWNYSKIRTYLNGTFLTNLQSKITNTIVSTEICADPSGDSGTTYGGYLMSELSALGKKSSCSTKVTDKVRLISLSEYYNMSPKYTLTSTSYPNVGNYIKKATGNYTSWLYCNSSACGDTNGEWWTMGSYSSSGYASAYMFAHQVSSSGDLEHSVGSIGTRGVRPVITIVK